MCVFTGYGVLVYLLIGFGASFISVFCVFLTLPLTNILVS